MLATTKHGVLGFRRGLAPLLKSAQVPTRITTPAPSSTDSEVIPSLKGLLNNINIDAQPAYPVARCAAYLMADTSMNGQLVHVQRGRYVGFDDAVLLPAYDKINGDGCPSEDEAVERLVAPAA
jgi:NAD(P)-dependent dehydrogenase (short-subunit alcohol dehydrogenase family)